MTLNLRVRVYQQFNVQTNPNYGQTISRYFCRECRDEFHYLALDLCQGSLMDFVIDKQFDKSDLSADKLLHQASMGLEHLHSIDIIHR